MTNQMLLLAQDKGGSSTPIELANAFVQRMDILNHPTELMSTLSSLHVVWASVLLVVGLLCVLNGYRWHKPVIIICALFSGLAVGRLLSGYLGDSLVVMGALGLLCAVIATPLMRYAVAIFGGLTGALIGANLWTAMSSSSDAHIAGAAMGFIALGLASFLLFRQVIVMFTSISGAAMAVLGAIALLLHVPAWEGAVRNSLEVNELLVPLLVLVAALSGYVLQQTTLAGDSKPAPAPAGA